MLLPNELSDLTELLRKRIKQNSDLVRGAKSSSELPSSTLLAIETVQATVDEAQRAEPSKPVESMLDQSVEADIRQTVTQVMQSALVQWLEPLAAVTEQIATIHQQINGINAHLGGDNTAIQELEAEYQKQLALLESQIEIKDATIADLETQLGESTEVLCEANTRIELLHAAFDESERKKSACHAEEIERFKGLLDNAVNELEQLRQQNADLAGRLAQQTADAAGSRGTTGSVNPEMLSWEERKQLMLAQLHADAEESESAASSKQKMEIEDVIATTDAEIARRDREIQELRDIVQSQSKAHEGVAIGAAGLAQLFDSDKLINEERERLKGIQQEWEAKLRQAEIDLSMERAKLARERVELETQLAQIQQAASQEQPSAGKSQNRAAGDKQRRWLDYLGLKEESGG